LIVAVLLGLLIAGYYYLIPYFTAATEYARESRPVRAWPRWRPETRRTASTQ
jgi:hypothetical protein